MTRRGQGRETWHRLVEWDQGQTPAERLAAQILLHERFQSVDPSHPLGGPDGLKDLLSKRDDTTWVAAAYFPRGKKQFKSVRRKFTGDAQGARKHLAGGFVFLTNQEITVGQREAFQKSIPDLKLELYHLERIASILNSPTMFGTRLEFLDIEMTREEQTAIFHSRDLLLEEMRKQIEGLSTFLRQLATGDEVALNHLRTGVPLRELKEFRDTLLSMTGHMQSGYAILNFGQSPLERLRVPIQELREFAALLQGITGQSMGGGISFVIGNTPIERLKVPLSELQQFKSLLDQVLGQASGGANLLLSSVLSPQRTIGDLRVPLEEMRQFRKLLDEMGGYGMSTSGMLNLEKALNDLREYERLLDSVLLKKRLLNEQGGPSQ